MKEAEGDMSKREKGSVSEPVVRTEGELGTVEAKSQEAIVSSPLAEGLRPLCGR